MTSHALHAALLGWFALSALVTVAVGVWVHFRTSVDGRPEFVALMCLDTLWVLTAAAAVTLGEVAGAAAATAQGCVGLVVAFAWWRFAATYTGRDVSLRRPRNAALAGLLLVFLWLVLVRPLGGRLTPLVELFPVLVIPVGLYYIGELFVKSRHRPSTSVFVFILGVLGRALRSS